ncbi:phosphotransferase [Streptomyces sp. NPDC028635]|uniref:phosphotransferase family protein n=1 Tax=Streptomyces sp. NPDC028635 TaxID=3154800 RepID=UPI0033F9DFCC
MPTDLLADLARQVRQRAHPDDTRCDACAASTLADRPDATVVRHAGTVAKAHAPHTDPAGLAPRLAVAARLPDVLLAPLAAAPLTLHGRPVTFWPYGAPVDPGDPDAAPWEAAATLLARLHRTPAPPGLPAMRGPAKAADAITRLRAALNAAPAEARIPSPSAEVTGAGIPPLAAEGTGAGIPPLSAEATGVGTPTLPSQGAGARTPTLPSQATGARTPTLPDDRTGIPPLLAEATPVLRAWAALPAWARAEAPMPGPLVLCHGDLHLGQLVRHPAPDGAWRLIDVDDLGAGVPAWDLARPAAWYACGLLPPQEYSRFLDAYRAAGGPAVPATGDPWPALDVPARALTVQTAARALVKADAAGRPLDEVERAVVDACARMDGAPAQTAAQVTP